MRTVTWHVSEEPEAAPGAACAPDAGPRATQGKDEPSSKFRRPTPRQAPQVPVGRVRWSPALVQQRAHCGAPLVLPGASACGQGGGGGGAAVGEDLSSRRSAGAWREHLTVRGGWRQAWQVRAVPGWRAPAAAESWTGEGFAGCPRVGETAGSAVRVFPPAKQCLLVKLCRIKSPKESKSLCTPGQNHFPFFDRDRVAYVTGPF